MSARLINKTNVPPCSCHSFPACHIHTIAAGRVIIAFLYIWTGRVF
ncbi:hypothetical protein SPAB_00290 [Salmonella enterica subsp. enterica serovar Paratyphi B str. SPB7]|uniref:Uncharacterized protein n=1 Tax=Salmonella paratyphi B (strain ATCC BAA-1250 / SPB7) TaxID=1016998 RepID=A0A6C6YY27_SALPB|nr:hypothetical protein SPAB_00290 [Salmonella enterica subsp. enterica serovar Paratyphi B str. SPB7]